MSYCQLYFHLMKTFKLSVHYIKLLQHKCLKWSISYFCHIMLLHCLQHVFLLEHIALSLLWGTLLCSMFLLWGTLLCSMSLLRHNSLLLNAFISGYLCQWCKRDSVYNYVWKSKLSFIVRKYRKWMPLELEFCFKV